MMHCARPHECATIMRICACFIAGTRSIRVNPGAGGTLTPQQAKEDEMRKLALSIAAAAVVFTAAPAMAQGIYFGPGGVGVDVGPRHHYRDYRGYPPGWYRGHHYGWYRHRDRDWDYD